MLSYIRKVVKKNKRLSDKILSDSWILNRIVFLQIVVYALKKGLYMYIPVILKNGFLHYIFGVNKDITIQVFKINLKMPNHMRWIDAAIEVFTDPLYDKFLWCDHVLDLWWYIWESAIRLSQNNKKVTTYEAHPENFKYLQKNISPFKNIIGHNFAIVGDEHIKEITFYGWWFNMWSGIDVASNNEKTTVSAITLYQIMQENRFDGIKIDIEWAEYECLQNIIDNGQLLKYIKKWLIEFHFNGNESRVQFISSFISLLNKEWYIIDYWDVENDKIIFNPNFSKIELIVIYFTK